MYGTMVCNCKPVSLVSSTLLTWGRETIVFEGFNFLSVFKKEFTFPKSVVLVISEAKWVRWRAKLSARHGGHGRVKHISAPSGAVKRGP